jgi:aspartate aminotransferase
MYGEEDAMRNRHLAGRLSNIVADTLTDLPGITFKAPAGGLYYFIDCREIVRKSTGLDQIEQFNEASLVDILSTQFNVHLQNGSTYGSPGFLRLHFAIDEWALEKGMEQLARGVRQLMFSR